MAERKRNASKQSEASIQPSEQSRDEISNQSGHMQSVDSRHVSQSEERNVEKQ